MVYKKGALSRYSRGPSWLPGRNAAKVASKALHIASKVARALNVEKKYLENIASGDFTSANQVILLNGVPQGDAEQTRDGDQIKMHEVYGHCRISNETTNAQNFRFILVQDKQADGTAPTVAEVLDLSNANPTQAFNNMDNKFRFRILLDKKRVAGCLSNPGTVGTSGWTQGPTAGSSTGFINFEYYYKFKGKHQGLHVRFSGTGATVSDIATNPIYLLIIADTAIGVGCVFESVSRVRYVDN